MMKTNTPIWQVLRALETGKAVAPDVGEARTAARLATDKKAK